MQLCSRCGENVPESRIRVDFPSLHARLRSEFGPASGQPEEINPILESLQQDLEDLETAGFGLQTHRSCIIELAAQTKSLLSPIRKIPDEILQDIFDYCCDTNSFVVSAPSETATCDIRNKPTMVLSSTCSRWYRNALSMPTLWSRITLDWNWVLSDFVVGSDAYYKRSFALATFLNRSLQQPLAVNIIIKGASPRLGNGTMHPIPAQLVEQKHRWKSLTFESPVILIHDLFEEYIMPELPLLDDLELLDPDDDLELFEDRALRLKALRMPYSFPFQGKERFTYPHLLHLELELDLDEDNPDLFQVTPNLVSLSIGLLESVMAMNSLRPCRRVQRFFR
ncbi:hypothetical protein GYMLUDRAFT_466852 [Collybiopsis luxurians FD-317 M1]|uniref:F-box domain-containing protein n=1 Tax=Collybiopsis luxurians FD-317 M1 TaxID=944289 RepID=A0A0D0BHI0_9AGAR|nr:hypothetical protein GYMLUDRAFT_466852 [Collybiopsis luxurians FD-317 M1]